MISIKNAIAKVRDGYPYPEILDETEDTIIAGHLPFMSKLASRLVTGNEDETVVHFKPGSVACLERGENGDGWTVQWFLRPELLEG